MNKAQTMSQLKISTIPVETFLYRSAQLPVALMTFEQFPDIQREARWSPDRFYGRRNEKLSDKVFVWTPPKNMYGVKLATPVKPVAKGETDLANLRPIDVYEIRDQFFNISEPEQGLRLFNQYGIFGGEHQSSFPFQVALSFADLLQWQKLLRECRLTEPGSWETLSKEYARLRHSSSILGAQDILIPLESPIRISLRCWCVRDAILAAIYLDKLANVKSSMCHRPDCGVVFNHESGHQRKYCTSDCAHLVAVRNERKRKAEAKSKAAKKAPNKKHRG
jgi:hypothetical protein